MPSSLSSNWACAAQVSNGRSDLCLDGASAHFRLFSLCNRNSFTYGCRCGPSTDYTDYFRAVANLNFRYNNLILKHMLPTNWAELVEHGGSGQYYPYR